MSTIKTHLMESLVIASTIDTTYIKPGTLVRLSGYPESLGVAISVQGIGSNWIEFATKEVCVLWSSEPRSTVFAMPPMHRINTRSIAKQLVSVQPMTAPAGGIFYIDYTYGSGSK